MSPKLGISPDLLLKVALGPIDFDWARIIAVYVDEPYSRLLSDHPSCNPNSSVGERAATLAAMAAALRIKAPSAKFWINFSQKEIDLILSGGCSFNQPYIDVVSMYYYFVDFYPTLSDRYQLLYENRATPHQQLALVAGTFTHRDQNGADGASRLSGYFTYAANMNQHCDLPLGPTGATRIYDGCPVWMVAGWTGGVTPPADDTRYFPIDNPASIAVLNRWQAAFAVPRVDPSRVRSARTAAALVPLWLID